MTINHRDFTALGTLFLLASSGLIFGCTSDEPTVDDLLDRSSAAYRNHTGYFHRLEWRYVVEIPTQNINSHGSGNHELTVDEDRNFRFGEFFGGVAAYRHGDELIVHRPYSGKFVTVGLTAGKPWSDSVPIVGGFISMLDPAALLATGQISDWRDHDLIDFDSATLISDKAGNRVGIQAKMDTSLFFGGPRETAVFWFDPDTYLLRSITVDWLETFITQNQLPETSEGQAYLKLEMSDAATGIQTSTGLLTFDPRPQDREAEQLAPPADDLDSASIMAIVGQVASPISADTLSGEKFILSSLQGNVVLLDFWASWCGYCLRSRPSIRNIGEQFAQNDLQIVSISLDDKGDRETVEKIADSSGIRAIEIHDYANAISTKYRVDVTPTFVLLNQSGVVEHVTMGPLLDENLEELEAKISSLLEN